MTDTHPGTHTGAPARRPAKTLAAVIGSAIGAVLLFTGVPREESSRTVTATIGTDQSVTVHHVAGNQHLAAYRDIVGVATACDGVTKGIRMGQRFSEAECNAMNEAELVAHAEPVIACMPSLYGRPYQAAAAIDLAYNVGTAGVCRSSLPRLAAAGTWRPFCDKLLEFTRAGGKVVRGLQLRRRRAWEACVTGIVAGATPANLDARVKAVR